MQWVRFDPTRLFPASIIAIALVVQGCAASESTPGPETTTPESSSTSEISVGLPQVTRARPSLTDRPADVFVAPAARGRKDGSAPEHAIALIDLGHVLDQTSPGAVIELVADQGPYEIAKPITLASGGTRDAPVTIRGPLTGPMPTLRGNRADPYSPTGDPGPVLFRLAHGADHLVFARLSCERIGNGCFKVVDAISDLSIDSVTARNVRRFFENGTSGSDRDASISGLTISNVEVEGFSKGAIRLGHETHDVLVIDVVGDSQRQNGDNFAIGVHLVDGVHDVRLERVSMANALDSMHAYWNGDGFATEEEVRSIHLVDTHAANNSDAGYDLKSSDTVVEGATAVGNSRNYRLWGRDMVLDGCSGMDPHLQGGNGSQIQVQVQGSASVEVRSCTFEGADSSTVVFGVENAGRVRVTDTVVEHSAAGELAEVDPGASFSQQDMSVTSS